MARKPFVKAKAMQGRGHLQSVTTDGPHVEWLGMPEYYIHALVIAEQEYAYFSANKDLEFELGAYIYLLSRHALIMGISGVRLSLKPPQQHKYPYNYLSFL